jgi:hypothetical protein
MVSFMNLCKNLGTESVEWLRSMKFKERGLEWLVILLATQTILHITGYIDCN